MRGKVDTNGGEEQVDVLVLTARVLFSQIKVFGQADPEFAVRLEVILPEMKNAVQKLRENMDEIQRKIDDTLIRLQRLFSTRSFFLDISNMFV